MDIEIERLSILQSSLADGSRCCKLGRIMFSPGQKVACVDDQFPLGIEKLYTALPTKDEIYTIRDLVPGVSLQNSEGEVAVYLVELVNPVNRHNVEYGFNAERFAPLVTDEDEVAEYEEAFAEEPAFAPA